MKASKYFQGSYLKSADLPRPVLVTIDRVVEEEVGDQQNKETKLVVYFRGKERGLVLNRTNAETLTALFQTDETSAWHGQPVCLYVDMTVTYGNTRGGIRVKPAPGNTQTARSLAAKAEPPPADAGEYFPSEEVPF